MPENKILVFKSHPAIFPGPASDAQSEAGNYRKRKVAWRGLTISIENEAGSIRRGVSRDGHAWEQRMTFPYGYAKRTMGVDGDHVDVFLGPNMDAPMVYVVHQRRYGDWEEYDEDKCMVGFASEDDARAAFLASYSDPRFLGPVTAIPADEFVDKAKATKENPTMIKALFFKGRVDPYIRGGRIVLGYNNDRAKNQIAMSKQRSFVFTREDLTHGAGNVGDYQTVPPTDAPPNGETKKFYVTMVREPGPNQRVAWLAGPFDTHDDALAQVTAARKKAEEVDPRAVFDAFGTSGLTMPEGKHPPGKLNEMLGGGKSDPAAKWKSAGGKIKLSENGAVITAMLNGRVAGKMIVSNSRMDDKPGKEVFEVVTNPAFRRKGAASAMLAAAEGVHGKLMPAGALSDDGFEMRRKYRAADVADDLRVHRDNLMGRPVSTPYGPGKIKSVGSGAVIAALDGKDTTSAVPKEELRHIIGDHPKLGPKPMDF
jgi:hypothetical protein